MLPNSAPRYPFSIVMKVAVSGHPACNLELGQEAQIPAHQLSGMHELIVCTLRFLICVM